MKIFEEIRFFFQKNENYSLSWNDSVDPYSAMEKMA